jgi:hypothetical protein
MRIWRADFNKPMDFEICNFENLLSQIKTFYIQIILNIPQRIR